MKHYDFEQGTPEWLEARKGVITGSKFRDARDRLKNGNPSSKAILYAQDVARITEVVDRAREEHGIPVPSVPANLTAADAIAECLEALASMDATLEVIT